MKLEGTVDIINRAAQSTGYGAKSRLGKPCKSILQVRNKVDRHCLIISTKKDPLWKEFDIKTIQNIRSRFAHDGFATIEISSPPMNIMLRNCDPGQLELFIADIKTMQATTKSKGAIIDKDVHPKSGGANESLDSSKTVHLPKLEAKKSESLRKSTGAVKRPRSPELSKLETERIKKVLRTNTQKLNVSDRANYPGEFPSTLKELQVSGINLRRIDKRILKLEFLNALNLSRNRLQCVDQLINLKGQLSTLNLSENEIAHIRADFFSHDCFKKLTHLDISKNKLLVLPLSVTESPLEVANFSGNRLKCLPYNWLIKGLRNLNVSDNDLGFLPAPILCYRLIMLDISKNPNLNKDVTEGFCDYIGYSAVPTLFETASEVVMSSYHKRFHLMNDLPISIKEYLKGCKFCIACGSMSLRYKICHNQMPSHSLAITVSEDSGRSMCKVKVIICYKCNLRTITARNLLRAICH